MKQLLVGCIVILLLANITNAEICITGQANELLKDKIDYTNITSLSLSELHDINATNCNLLIFSYFDEIISLDKLDIYEYTANNYVFWLGNPPYIPCIEKNVVSINVSGMITLNEHCNISEKADNIEIKIIDSLEIQEIGTLYANGKKYPVIFQSNGQNLIYFAYNAIETPDIMNCLINYAANITGENVKSNEKYFETFKTHEDALPLIVILIILFIGGAIVWKS
ncbi:MAG: hypothetical protein KAI55_02830 [Candidatus Aenigmarchaeota archaeon]|nr:hypothetical protein [Candidatus Aenigmarchaeota archaeon]